MILKGLYNISWQSAVHSMTVPIHTYFPDTKRIWPCENLTHDTWHKTHYAWHFPDPNRIWPGENMTHLGRQGNWYKLLCVVWLVSLTTAENSKKKHTIFFKSFFLIKSFTWYFIVLIFGRMKHLKKRIFKREFHIKSEKFKLQFLISTLEKIIFQDNHIK